MNILEVQDLCKTYGTGETEVHALNHVSFSVRKGEFIAIIGESGSGKSTLLNVIGALDSVTSGRVWIDGQDIFSMPEKKLTVFRRQHIGFIFQSFNLIPELNVEQNITFPLLLDYKKPNQKFVNELLQVLGLSERRKHLPSQLSGGQQQRVALARALVIEPSVLLFDEPLSNLDAKLRVTMRTEIRKIQQKVGITAIYVTHDQSEAMSISDKIIIMSKGKVEQIGTPREIYYHPNSRFVADFIGEANFLEARVRSASGEKAVIDVVGQELTVNNFAKAGPGDDAVLVIRPEGATLAEQGLLEGTVTLSTFMGSYQYYQVMVGNMEIQITDYNPVNRRIYEVGEKAYLDFDPKGVYIL